MSAATLNFSNISPQAAGFDWIYWKTWLSFTLGQSDDLLHVHAGLLLLMIAALVLRRPPWDWRAWLCVLIIESANELYDVFQTSYSTNEGNWTAAWQDFWLTMLWPTAVMLLFPIILRRVRPAASEQTP